MYFGAFKRSPRGAMWVGVARGFQNSTVIRNGTGFAGSNVPETTSVALVLSCELRSNPSRNTV
jgi:hypothetical protein